MERKKAEKKTRKSYTIKEKLEWVEKASKPGMSQAQVAQKFGISPCILNRTLAKKDDLLPAAGSNKIKRMSHGVVKELEDELYVHLVPQELPGPSVRGSVSVTQLPAS